MPTLLVEFAVRVALIAAAVATLSWMMRIKSASARHAVWAGLVLVMLLLPAFLSWGPKASLPLLPREARRTPVATLPVAGTPLVAAVQARVAKEAPPKGFVWSWPAFLARVYLLGLAVLIIRLAIGTMRVSRLVRGAVLRDGRLTHASCATPVTVGWARPAVILPASWSEWPQARVSRARMACLVALCAVTAAIFAAGTLVRAQDKRQSGPAFEVAAVRLGTPGAMQIIQRPRTPSPDQPKVEPVTAGQIAAETTKYQDRRLLALYFDMTGMPIPDLTRALAAAQKFIQTQMSGPDLMCIMEYAGAAFGRDQNEFNIFLADRRLASLQAAVKMLGTLSETKTLLYFASGLNLNGTDNQAQRHATVNAAVRADVSVYPIDSRGGSSGGQDLYIVKKFPEN